VFSSTSNFAGSSQRGCFEWPTCQNMNECQRCVLANVNKWKHTLVSHWNVLFSLIIDVLKMTLFYWYFLFSTTLDDFFCKHWMVKNGMIPWIRFLAFSYFKDEKQFYLDTLYYNFSDLLKILPEQLLNSVKD